MELESVADPLAGSPQGDVASYSVDDFRQKKRMIGHFEKAKKTNGMWMCALSMMWMMSEEEEKEGGTMRSFVLPQLPQQMLKVKMDPSLKVLLNIKLGS